MNSIRIAFKELKAFRDVKMLVFMLATPVMLILILGMVLTNVFNGSITIGEICVLYNNHSEDPNLAANWNELIQEAEKTGIRFEQLGNNIDGHLEVESGRYAGYTVLTDQGIDYYGNSHSSIENSIVTGMLTSFTDRNNLNGLIPDLSLSRDEKNYMSETALLGSRQPSALDYFAVAVTTMMILYSAMPAAQLIENERTQKTALRLMASPVTKAEIFTGKILGHLLLQVLFILIIIFISKFMFHAYWGNHLGLVILVLVSQIVFTLSLGLGISYLIKGKAAIAVIMMLVQVELFWGGAYFPAEWMSGFLGEVSQYSPLRRTNDAILQIVYADQLSVALPTIVLNVGLGALLLMLAVIMMRRREGL